MIADKLHSFASAAFYPVLVAVCAAMAMRYSIYWIHTSNILTLIAAATWIIAMSGAIWVSIQLQIDAQVAPSNRGDTKI